MIKEKNILLVVGLFLILFMGVSGVMAVSGVDLRITGTVAGSNSGVWLRTDSNAASLATLDAYDMPAPSSPDDYSKFYSTSAVIGFLEGRTAFRQVSISLQ